MPYELAQPWTGGERPIALSEADFLALRRAKDGMVHTVALEEKMDMVLESLVDLERDFLDLSYRSAVFQEYSWSVSRERTQLVNRRLLGLLSAGYLYLEQSQRDLVGVGGRQLLAPYRAAREAQRTGNPGFRIMSAIRDHIQHCGLPISGLMTESRRVGANRERRRHMVRPILILLDALERDRDFDRDALQMLRDMGEGLDLNRCSREYVSGIGTIHTQMRELIATQVQAWHDFVYDSLHRYQRETGAGLDVGVEVRRLSDSGQEVETFALFFDLLEHRQALFQKNQYITNLGPVLVTSN